MADKHASSPPAEGAPRRRSRFRRFLTAIGVLLLAIAAFAWFLPAIVAATALKDALVKAALPQFRGEIRLERLSLGWLSPVRAQKVAVHDETGAALVELGEAATAKPLWQLLVDPQNLGAIHLNQPIVHAVVRDGGSNLEDALAPLLEGPSSGGVACVIHIADGQGILREQNSPRQTLLREIAAEISVPAATTEEIRWRMAARVAEGDQAADAATEGRWRPSERAWGVGQVKVETHAFSLDALAPLLTRFGVGAELTGRVDLRGEFTLADDGRQSVRLEQLMVQNLATRAPQSLGSETLRLKQLHASGEAVLTEELITLHDAKVACDIGQIQGSGATRWEALSAPQIVAALRRSSFNFEGELDLARLAEVFPRSLHLREDLTISSGVVRVSGATRDDGDVRRWEGRLETSNLTAVQQGRPLAWDRPLVANFAVRDAAEGPVMEHLACQSDFLQVTGRGSLAEGDLSVQGDLSKLAAELNRFLNLGAMQFGGTLRGELHWRPGDEGHTAAEGNLRLSDFQWSAAGRRPWREPQLQMEFSTAGLLDKEGVRRIAHGRVSLTAGADAATAKLRAPVEIPTAAADWLVECEARGQLASWLPRLENFLPLAGWDVEGQLTLNAAGSVSAQRVQLESARAIVDQLYVAGGGWTIREPRVEAQTDLIWEGAQDSLSARQATFASSTVAFRAQNVAANLKPGAFAASGEIDFRGDLSRLAQWRQAPQSRPTLRLEGMTVGRLLARQSGEGVHVQGTADIENLSYSVPARVPVPGTLATPAAQSITWSNLWQEPRLRLSTEATYTPQSDSLALKQFSAAGEALQLQTQGAVADLSNTCRVDLTGEVDYDLQTLLTRLRPLIGPDLKMTGRGPRPFRVQGPLWAAAAKGDASAASETGAAVIPPELTAQGSLAWATAEYLGVKAGAGEAAIALTGGVVTLGPLDLPVSEGRLTVAPRVLLNAAPMMAQLDAGPMLQNVRISPEMCRTWLKYVAPLVADAAQAEGRFSLELTQPAHVPLAEPTRTETRGTLTVHAAQVGPGPLSRQFLTLAEQVKAAVERKTFAPGGVGSPTWLVMAEQKIGFELAGSRVYHRDLQVTSGEVVIRTRGSVGLDQTLDLLAEVPIHDRWVDREPLLAGFRGQTLQIPVSGTTTAPRLDQRATEEFARQMMGDAARRLLEQNLKIAPDLQRTFEQLFRRK